MESIIEDQRCFHEERERLIDAMVKEMTFKKNTMRDRVNSDHRIKLLLDRYVNVTRKLKELYDDPEGWRKREINALSGPNEFAEFYTRLRHIKEFYKKHPNEISVPMSIEFEEIAKARENPTDDMFNMVDFSDEEGYGKYLDLIECHEKYVNLKGVEKIDYITYLSVFDQLHEIAKSKKGQDYRKYLLALVEYLYGFVVRIKPLFNIDAELESAQTKALNEWENGNFPGWTKEASSALSNVGARLDLSEFQSADELAALGLDRLKTALIALDMKCGGTLDERAKRLFATKATDGQPNEKDLVRNKKATEKERELVRHRELVQLEGQVYRLAELVQTQRAATKENVQRRQARTDAERDESEEELSEADTLDDDDDDDGDDDVPYNPKNLPLGWDGKPIPYWLYKLHGLNISYSCEICGNFVYKGPKAFQMHFAEWRHAHGMRCLGIPNTAHFANVTQIEDALKLWEKLRSTKQVERWIPEVEEEFEDTLGNVVNKKTYEDLKRQGLL